MPRRALILGASTYDLGGADGDARRVASALTGRGFEVDLRCGCDATRAGILAGLDRLIAQSGADTAAVIYYAGHGGRAINTDPRAGDPRYPEVPRVVPFIVPFDHGHTDDVVGVTAWEMSCALAALTARTANVVAVFDCCHAADQARSARHRARARSLAEVPRAELSRQLARISSVAPSPVALDAVADPKAVRWFACGEHELAWEHRRADGTEVLLDVLASAGARARRGSPSRARSARGCGGCFPTSSRSSADQYGARCSRLTSPRWVYARVAPTVRSTVGRRGDRNVHRAVGRRCGAREELLARRRGPGVR